MYPGGLGCLFTKILDEICDFFEYLAHDSWEYDNAREAFSHSVLDLYVMRVISLNERRL